MHGHAQAEEACRYRRAPKPISLIIGPKVRVIRSRRNSSWGPQRSLFHFGVKRVTEKRPPPEVDQAEVERDVEAKRQARKQREQDAAVSKHCAWTSCKWSKWRQRLPSRMDGTRSRGEPENHLENAGNSWEPLVNHLRKPWKLVALPVKHLERKIFWSPTVYSLAGNAKRA
jgi:hypothetical protein